MERLKSFLFAMLLFIVVHGDDQSGFISIDCGIPEDYKYTDNDTSINYVSDAGFINGSGLAQSILPIYQTPFLATQLLTVRSFPEGSRNCYTLRPEQGKGNRYLIRATFMYGNYDSTNQLPQFDLHLGTDRWTTVNITGLTTTSYREIIHVPLSNYMHICLINTGLGTPFISALELRFLPLSVYPTEFGSLITFDRANFGTYFDTVRYTQDKYDRLWARETLANTTAIQTFNTVGSLFSSSELPQWVIESAIKPKAPSDSIVFPWDPKNSTDQFLIYIHLAEIEVLTKNQTREFNIYLNGKLLYGPFSPLNLSASTIYSTSPEDSYPTYVLTMNKTRNSTLPPIINAIELYVVKQLRQWQTDDRDAAAIWSTKSVYKITENSWQGDPCAPQAFVWNGLNCGYNGSQPPRIVSLNLSSWGLTGEIVRSLANLTMLQTLDLSNNNLAGTIPDFLSQLTFLRVLNLKGNNFTGSVPAVLQDKSNQGALSLSLDQGNMGGIANSCGTDSCKSKKPQFRIPVVASVAALFVVLIASVVLWMIRRHKLSQDPKLNRRLVELKNRQFTYSEIKSITNNFREVIGKGGFGTVYHGYISETEVAVKMLSLSSIQGYKEFQAEANLLTSVHHKNLTSLIGYCYEGSKMGIIYEYMANGSLERHLSDRSPNVLSWEDRLKIGLDAAQGLEYLHHGCQQPIVHRDVKCTNILLNEKFQAKLADFGLSRAFPVEGGSHVSTVIAGTPGYLDPEYYTSNRLTEKSDVYGYGVVLLEIITSRPAIEVNDQGNTHLSQWVNSMLAEGTVENIVDPRLEGNFDVYSVKKAVKLAMACVARISTTRPTMNDVVMDLKDCLAFERAHHGTDLEDSLRFMSLNLESVEQ